MKRLILPLTLLALCLPAFAQFNPYEESKLIVLVPTSKVSQGNTTNYTAVAGDWIDLRHYVGVGAVSIMVYSNSAGNTAPFDGLSTLTCKLQGSVDMTNATALAVHSLATAASTKITNFTYTAGLTNDALVTTNIVYTPSADYTSSTWAGVSTATATLAGGVPITSIPRYVRLLMTTSGNTNATWIVSATLRARSGYAQ